MQTTETEVLERYFEVYHELWVRRRRLASRQFVRLAALLCVGAEGWPREVGERVRDAEQTLQRLPWHDALRGQMAVVVAAMLVSRGLEARTFLAELERIRRLFRDEKVSRGGLFESLAILLLWIEKGSGLSRDDVKRFKALWKSLKADHSFLVGTQAYPLTAALTSLPEETSRIAGRVEELHRRLETAGVKGRADRLAAARILALSPDPDDALVRRLAGLLQGFRDDGVRIWASDAPIVSPLAFARVSEVDVVRRVAALRERLSSLRPRPGKQETFNLGCALCVIELAVGGRDGGAWERVTPALGLAGVAQILVALVASTSGGGAAAAIAASG